MKLRDRRFRRKFNRALRILERKGRITATERHRYRMATFNTYPIAYGGQSGAFVGLLRNEVEKEMKTSGFIFELFDFQAIIQWLVENWEVVLRIILMLLVFIETPEEPLTQ